jgi:hypothetical protein
MNNKLFLKKAYIYMIRRKDNHDEVYIGQTKLTLKLRLRSHKYGKCNKEFHDWLKYHLSNDNIEIIDIEMIEYINESDINTYLNFRERYWDNFYRSCNKYKVLNKLAGNTGRNDNKYNSKPICINGIKYNSENEARLYDSKGLYNSKDKKEIKKRVRLWKDNPINKDKVKKWKDNWSKSNPDKVKEISKRIREKNKDEINKRTRDWRIKNPDKIKEYKLKNKDEINKKRREKVLNDPEYRNKINERSRLYRKNNLERVRENERSYSKRVREMKNKLEK